MMPTYKCSLVMCAALVAVSVSGIAVADDDGAKVVAEVCSQCHSPKRNPLDKLQLTKEQWKEAIERMAGYGAEVPKAKLPSLLDYLVSMNSAAADPTKK